MKNLIRLEEDEEEEEEEEGGGEGEEEEEEEEEEVEEGRAERGDGSRFYTEVEREDAVTKRVGHQNLISNFPDISKFSILSMLTVPLCTVVHADMMNSIQCKLQGFVPEADTQNPPLFGPAPPSPYPRSGPIILGLRQHTQPS